jgi:hypothetical protein
MTGEQSQRGRGPYRSRAEAELLVAEYEGGGLSSEEFCKQKKISFKTLARYRARYGPQKAKDNAAPRLVAVEVAKPSGSGSDLCVLLSSGRRIEVKRDFDVVTLRQLMTVLEQA